MDSKLTGEINLAATLDCGQAFRWRRDGDWFRGVIGKHVVWLRQGCGSELNLRRGAVAIRNRSHEGVEWMAFPKCDGSVVANYLALSDPLEKIVESFPDDPHFRAAAQWCCGMRMLRQEPWETLASFIASSTKQIVQIRQIVQLLCESLGEEISDGTVLCHSERSEESTSHGKSGEIFRFAQNDSEAKVEKQFARIFSFPSPAAVAASTHETLWNCKLGFRAKYLLSTARRIDSGKLDLSALAKMETARAHEELMKCDGVGEKIANCVLLFGYARHEACPIDVWIGRALQQLYFRKKRNVTPKRLREFASSYLGPNAGYAQQYLFHYVRMNPEVVEM